MSQAPLTCTAVGVRFGEFTAVSDVSLSFSTGQVTALIGPNGAGKTTLLNTLSGQQVPSTGRVTLFERDVTGLLPYQRARLGLGRSFQIMSVFADDTVEENLRIAGQRSHHKFPVFWRPADSYAAVNRDVDEMLGMIGLTARRKEPAGRLSHGEQRALEVGLSLMNQPRVLLLDEPFAGIGRNDIDPFVALLQQVCATRTVVLVEHNMDAVMKLSQGIVVLVGGRVLAAGEPATIKADPRVRAAYLG
jgi:branched-chain amino acid transport system ATP-binding protein